MTLSSHRQRLLDYTAVLWHCQNPTELSVYYLISETYGDHPFFGQHIATHRLCRGIFEASNAKQTEFPNISYSPKPLGIDVKATNNFVVKQKQEQDTPLPSDPVCYDDFFQVPDLEPRHFQLGAIKRLKSQTCIFSINQLLNEIDYYLRSFTAQPRGPAPAQNLTKLGENYERGNIQKVVAMAYMRLLMSVPPLMTPTGPNVFPSRTYIPPKFMSKLMARAGASVYETPYGLFSVTPEHSEKPSPAELVSVPAMPKSIIEDLRKAPGPQPVRANKYLASTVKPPTMPSMFDSTYRYSPFNYSSSSSSDSETTLANKKRTQKRRSCKSALLHRDADMTDADLNKLAREISQVLASSPNAHTRSLALPEKKRPSLPAYQPHPTMYDILKYSPHARKQSKGKPLNSILKKSNSTGSTNTSASSLTMAAGSEKGSPIYFSDDLASQTTLEDLLPGLDLTGYTDAAHAKASKKTKTVKFHDSVQGGEEKPMSGSVFYDAVEGGVPNPTKRVSVFYDAVEK